jgi:hypothetical protein
MILFVTDYDDATRSNRLIAEPLRDNFEEVLIGEDATRAALHSMLTGNQKPLFAMSHGRPDRMNDQDRNPAIHSGDILLASRRAVFAFACHTATTLGRKVASAGGIWWGYTGPIASPPDDPEQRLQLQPIFEHLMRFVEYKNPAEVIQFLEELKDYCEEAAKKVGPNGKVFDAHLCIHHALDKLRVWLPTEQDALHHPAVTSGFIFD